MIKTYSELIQIPTFNERLEYLKTGNVVGYNTFGYYRKLNQDLYRSYRWKKFRNEIIIRDDGNDLGCDGYRIFDKIIIHHINSLTIDDLVNMSSCVFDPDNVICVSFNTHNVLHYSNDSVSIYSVDRSPNDMCPWRR